MFLQTSETWVDHDKSEEIQIPRYLKVVTFSSCEWLTSKVSVGVGGCRFLDITMYLHFAELSVRWLILVHKSKVTGVANRTV